MIKLEIVYHEKNNLLGRNFLLFTACKNDDGAGMANLEYEGGEVSVKIEEGTGISLFNG